MSTTLDTAPDVSAIANWFGSARMVAERIGREMGKRSLVVVPFAGGMSELPYFETNKLLVNDRHRHVINLANVIAHPMQGPQLYRRLRRRVFHPKSLAEAQTYCRDIEDAFGTGGLFVSGDEDLDARRLAWAEAYAIASWMGRGGKAGTRGEFKGALPLRYSPNGGGSAQRFHNWVASIPAWRRVLRKCEFTTDDALDVLAAGHDTERCGYYSDSPWPDAGDDYLHRVDYSFLRKLATAHARFTKARVVVRYADHPLIRELYPEGCWTWVRYPSRAQTNQSFDEALLINGPALTGGN